jgi:chromosome segregation ATPase
MPDVKKELIDLRQSTNDEDLKRVLRRAIRHIEMLENDRRDLRIDTQKTRSRPTSARIEFYRQKIARLEQERDGWRDSYDTFEDLVGTLEDRIRELEGG